MLSRDVTAAPIDSYGLVEVPVTVDWFGHRKGVRWTELELAGRIAADVAGGGPVGVMLHHAVTDDEELAAIAELLKIGRRARPRRADDDHGGGGMITAEPGVYRDRLAALAAGGSVERHLDAWAAERGLGPTLGLAARVRPVPSRSSAVGGARVRG